MRLIYSSVQVLKFFIAEDWNILMAELEKNTMSQDISDLEIEMDVRTGPGSSQFVRKSLPLAQAAREFDDAVFDHAPFKWQSRWYQGLRALTGIKHFTSHHRTLAGNG